MFDIVIVGAGASGIGLGVLLQKSGLHHFTILEHDHIGTSFDQWPKEMRMITPSFPGQGFGALDLNAVVPYTSPAYMFENEHLSGTQYADYLRLLAKEWHLPIQEQTKVSHVKRRPAVFI